MNPDENPLHDYYAALQVHPEAEEEVIRAAYRQLMRKYHPDNLPAEQETFFTQYPRIGDADSPGALCSITKYV